MGKAACAWSPQVQAFPAPSYLLPGAGRVASAHFHPQALVPEDQELLGVLHRLGLSGKGVPVVRRPLHVAPEIAVGGGTIPTSTAAPLH